MFAEPLALWGVVLSGFTNGLLLLDFALLSISLKNGARKKGEGGRWGTWEERPLGQLVDGGESERRTGSTRIAESQHWGHAAVSTIVLITVLTLRHVRLAFRMTRPNLLLCFLCINRRQRRRKRMKRKERENETRHRYLWSATEASGGK